MIKKVLLEKKEFNSSWSFDVFLAFLFCLLFFIFYLFGEVTFINDGFGWDGVIYASWVKDVPAIFNNQIDSYYITRTAPSTIVNLMMRVFKISLSQENILETWKVFNLFNFFISTIILSQITNIFKFNKKQKILAFSIIFLNFATLKAYHLLPISTDVFALTLSISLFYAFLKNYSFLLICILFIGGFTWPSFFLLGLPLYVFPLKKHSSKVTTDGLNSLSAHVLSLIIKLTKWLLPLSFGLFVTYLFTFNNYETWIIPAIASDYTPIQTQLLFVSTAFIILYLYKGSTVLLQQITKNKHWIILEKQI